MKIKANKEIRIDKYLSDIFEEIPREKVKDFIKDEKIKVNNEKIKPSYKLILEDESGLKIPKSSVTKKDFYLVPENYLTQGGNSKETGVLIHNDSDDAQFKKVDVYYRDTETGMVYLDPNAFDKNTTLIKPDSTETYKLKKTKSLQGVYNINKGYAVFKQIHILCESDEYYIVESGNSYGLANYDHIALVGKDVRENDIVY